MKQMLLPTIHVSVIDEDTGEKYIEEFYSGIQKYIHDYERDELIFEYECGSAVISYEDFPECTLKTVIEVIE